jgi:D-lactate dehydrogenase
MGFDLRNKILGVIGAGNIGQNVIKIAKGFDMQVIAYDKKVNQELSKKLEFTYVDSLELLLKNSDIITLHLPCNKYTYHIINIDKVRLIKQGAILINTARGALIETAALIYALENNIVSGLGLDVLEEEAMFQEEEKIFANKFENQQLKTLIANHYLINHDKVIITPHNAFNTKEAIYRVLETTEKNIRSFLNNNPINIVV